MSCHPPCCYRDRVSEQRGNDGQRYQDAHNDEAAYVLGPEAVGNIGILNGIVIAILLVLVLGVLLLGLFVLVLVLLRFVSILVSV